jgi:signal transduction histidine kinase
MIVIRTAFGFSTTNIKIIAAIILAEVIAIIALALGMNSFLLFLFLLLFGTTGVIYIVSKYVLRPYDEEVQDRLQNSVDQAMKAEKLKSELITNVSHDLKTPLTAIINYSDLLVKQDKNNEYARIIYEKSRKLQHLTEDLFEVSKAQSGNISVNMENLNLMELINQTMAEFDDSGLEFKINIPPVNIMADGKLISRVFENLIGNIIKYSLPGTRVYIDGEEIGQKVHITFKNIASYEMNFDSSEVMERFSRGDQSRTTDGSGLGLAIAQSYTEACGGRLNIDIDGDLFKVTIMF